QKPYAIASLARVWATTAKSEKLICYNGLARMIACAVPFAARSMHRLTTDTEADGAVTPPARRSIMTKAKKRPEPTTPEAPQLVTKPKRRRRRRRRRRTNQLLSQRLITEVNQKKRT